MVQVGFPFKITGITNVFIGASSRAAAGDQSITGVGFVPKVVIFFSRGTGGTNQVYSSGFSDGSVHRCVFFAGHTVDLGQSASYCIVTQLDAGNAIQASIKSLDADGFTLTWVLSGVVTSQFTYLAMK